LQDLNKLMENRVKNAIAQTCMKRGIAKTEVYYCIGGHGMVGPLVATNPETGEQAVIGFKPLWNLQLGLRSTLIGQEPIIGGLPIPSVFPTADEIEFVVDRLLGELQQMRDKQNTVPKLEVGRN
jgi:hypothetical protein